MPDSGLAVYGPLAERFAGGFTRSDPVIIFDHTGAGQAVGEALRRSFRGERFFVRPILQDEHAMRADAVAPAVTGAFTDRDQLRVAAAQAFEGSLRTNGSVLREMPVYAPGALRLMQAAVRLSDGAIFSSYAERRRVQHLLQSDPPAAFRDLRDPSVPAPSENDLAHARDAVLIWAPELAPQAAALFAAALSDLHAPLLLATDTCPDRSAAAWVPQPEWPAALKRAKVVVVTNAYGADSALALAAWKTRIVVDTESGAQESLERAHAFERFSPGSLFAAVLAALGDAPTIYRARRDVVESAGPGEALLSEGPLVSVVMPTFNRPRLLRYALESCRRQSYRSIETIVAVGGGARFDDLMAEYPEVRFIHLDENVPAASLNAAFSAARGEYVAVLNDDDLFLPNHIAALATALKRSGAALAHGDVLTAFLEGSEERWQLYGFESNMSRSVELSSLLVANRIGATSALVRRSCVGTELYDMSIPYYRDYALWLSIGIRHDFVHVERITSCYTIRNQGSAQQTTSGHDNAAAAYQAIYGRFPVPSRPAIEQQRAQMLQSVRAGSTALASEPAMRVPPADWPPF